MGKKRKQTFEDISVKKKAKIEEKVDAFLEESSDEESSNEDEVVQTEQIEEVNEEEKETEDFGGFVAAGAEAVEDDEEIGDNFFN